MKIRHINNPNDIVLRATKESKSSLQHIKDIFNKGHNIQKHGYIDEEEHDHAGSDTLGNKIVRVQNTYLSRTFQKSSIINRSQREAILWHYRFGHIKNLSNLYHVTKLKKAIQHAIFYYDIYHLAKSKKRRNHTISQRSNTLLDRISVDIYGKLLKDAKDYLYFLMIIDNYSYYIAVIPAKKKTIKLISSAHRRKKRNYILIFS